MKAIVIEEPGAVKIIDKKKPKPKENEALIKIKYCGFCGSDLQVYKGTQPFASYPRIPGHEFSGVIEEINGKSSRFSKGMKVTGYPYFSCKDQNEKECYACQNEKYNCCEYNETMGVQKDGAFAEYVTMPLDKLVSCKNLSLKEAALLEPFGISYHALKRRAKIKKEQNILIIGSGAIGLFALITAKLNNCDVYINDILENRLKLASELGATETINSKEDDFKERLKDLTTDKQIDMSVDAVGLSETFMKCINYTSFGGKVILIGNGTEETTFNHSIIIKKELDILGSRNSNDVLEELVNLIKDNDISLNKLISKEYNFTDAKRAFEDLSQNRSKYIKILLKFE